VRENVGQSLLKGWQRWKREREHVFQRKRRGRKAELRGMTEK